MDDSSECCNNLYVSELSAVTAEDCESIDRTLLRRNTASVEQSDDPVLRQSV